MINNFRKWITSKLWRKTFIRILLSYIFVISIAIVIIGTLIIGIISRKYYQETYDLNIKILNQRISIYEQILLKKPGDILMQLALSNTKYRHLVNNNPRENILIVKELIDDISNIKNLSSYIQSIYIYMGKFRAIISTDGFTILDQNMKLNSFVIESYNIDWLNNSNKNSVGNIFRIIGLNTDNNEIDGTGELNSIAYVMQIQNNQLINNTVMAVIMDEDKIHEAINDKNRNKISNILILNNDGKVLTYNNVSYKDLRLENEFLDRNILSDGYRILKNGSVKYFVCYTTSVNNGWRYITWAPFNETFYTMRVTNGIVVVVCALVWIICIFTAYVFSSKQYSQLSRVVKFITDAFPDIALKIEKDNDYLLIKNIVKLCANRMNIMEKKISENTLNLRYNTIRSLILGEWTDILEFKNQLLAYNVEFTQNNIYIITTKLRISQEIGKKTTFSFDNKEYIRNIYKELLENRFEMLSDVTIYTVWIGCDYLVFVLNMLEDNKNEDLIEKVFEESSKQLQKLYGVSLIAGVNKGDNDLTKIPSIYHGSLLALDQDYFYKYQTKYLYFFYKLNDNIDLCFNDLKICEKNIYKCFNAQDIEECKKYMDEIARVAINNQISCKVIKKYISEVVMQCIIELKQNNEDLYMKCFNNKNIIADLNGKSDFQDVKLMLESFLSQIQTVCNEKKNNHRVDLINKVKDIMEKRVTENISLDVISEMLFLNADYLRHIFKDETGITFSDYTRMIKMSKAKTLLFETDWSINKISTILQYNSIPYFIRIFKETYGMTPKEYRVKHRNIIYNNQNNNEQRNDSFNDSRIVDINTGY